MSRTLLCLAVVTALFDPSCPCRADEAAAAPETLIRLSVEPAPSPQPALRYRLLPELLEMNPGNPIPHYFTCLMGQHKFFFDMKTFEGRKMLLTMPLEALPAQELLDHGRFALSQADWAARLDAPDWQILPKLMADGDFLLLPDLQELRTLAKPSEGSVSGPRSLWAASTMPSEQPRRCSPCRATSANTRRSLPSLVGYYDRERGHRPSGGDVGAPGLPQPLLGADKPAQSPGLAGQEHGRPKGM